MPISDPSPADPALAEQFHEASLAQDLERMRELLSLGADPDHGEGHALRHAARSSNHQAIELLLSLPGSRLNLSLALRSAAVAGAARCAELLAPLCSPKKAGDALREAARAGQSSVLPLLTPFCDPKANDSEALRAAAAHGKIECVALLIHVCDPLARGGQALRLAAENNHAECVRLLLPASLCFAPAALRAAAERGAFEGLEPLLAVCDAALDDHAALRLACSEPFEAGERARCAQALIRQGAPSLAFLQELERSTRPQSPAAADFLLSHIEAAELAQTLPRSSGASRAPRV